MHVQGDPIRYGLIGCGRFGRFCLDALRDAPGIKATAVADLDPNAAQQLALSSGLVACSAAELVARADVDLVHIATPPWTHYELARAALDAKKHVLCEKPLALTLAQAIELVELSTRNRVLLAVNHLLRYNELISRVKWVLDRGILGRPLHAFFENYAEDEHLPLEHWFWDRQKSGGIFVEHGVHFFDLHRWWFGKGTVLSAAAVPRQATGQVDRVTCTALHESGVIATCYHGFDQPGRLDRADHRIVCERGDLRVSGWIPQRLEVDGILSAEQRAELTALGPWDEAEESSTYSGDDRLCHGRGNRYQVDSRVRLTRTLALPKPELYAHMFRRLVSDQLAAVASPDHASLLSASDAREAVEMAEVATRFLEFGRTVKENSC